MKCALIKGIKEFEVKEIDEPKSTNGSVLMDIKKCGICGSDIHNWVAGQPEGLVMGHEFCGIVTDPGSRNDLKVGDRVTALPLSPCGHCEACYTGNIQYCPETWTYATGLAVTNPGGLAPKISVRPDMVIKVPDNLKDEEVAMTEPMAVGLHAVNLANIKIGSKVLVVGGGIIGLASALFAKRAGASYVVISETNKERGQKSVDLNVADSWVDATNSEEVNKLINSFRGFDVVIECCGNEPAVTSAIMAVKPGGTVVLVGVATKPIAVPIVVAVMREITVQGAIAYTKKRI